MARFKKSRSLQVRVADWLAVSRAATIIDWLNSLLSLLSVVIYIVETYIPPMDELELAQDCFNFFFVADFLVHFYAAESRLAFLRNQYAFVDFVTIVPSLLSFAVLQVGSSRKLSPSLITLSDVLQDLTFLRIIRLLKLKALLAREVEGGGGQGYNGLKVEQEVFFHILQFFVVMLCFAGLFMVVENRFATESMRARRGSRHNTFHDSFYFVATLLSTVGYGDIIPLSIPGKFLVIVMIISSLVFVGDKLNKISLLINSSSPYARVSYSPAHGSRHVVVCGNFSLQSIEDFLSEFFHKDHGTGSDTCNVVLLASTPPSLSIKLLLELDTYFMRVRYVEGLVMKEKDLARVKAEQAECVFILTNKDSTDAKAMDAATIFRAMSVKKYVRMKANKDVFVVMQLIQSSSKIHFLHSCYGSSSFQIVCTDEVKQGLLGKSCLCSGFSTLISNLVTSSSIYPQEHMETWVIEYVTGCSKEVYRTRLSRAFEGRTFGQVSNTVFAKYNCTLFALEIVDREGRVRVVLNPSRYEIPSGNVFGYIISEDNSDAVAVSQHDLHDLRGPAGSEVSIGKGADGGGGDGIGSDADILGTAFASGGPWHRPVNTAEAEVFMPIQEAVARKQRIFHYLNEPRGLNEACPSDLEAMKGHILLLSNAHSIAVFVETLRQKHVPLKPIVVLCPELPTQYLWTRLSHFPKVYFIQGQQKSRADLLRAGVLGVDTAVIISMDSSEISPHITEERGGWRLLDADCLFAYQAILKYRPTAKVICQLSRANNIQFMSPDLGQSLDVMVAPPFSSGTVYLSAMLDRLTCQCFYNRNLLSILQALVSSGNCTEEEFSEDVHPSELCTVSVPPSFEGKTYMQLFQYLISKKDMLPLGLYRYSPVDDVSPQPYVITNPPQDLLLNARDAVYVLVSYPHPLYHFRPLVA